jgi:hypothetical protein
MTEEQRVEIQERIVAGSYVHAAVEDVPILFAALVNEEQKLEAAIRTIRSQGDYVDRLQAEVAVLKVEGPGAEVARLRGALQGIAAILATASTMPRINSSEFTAAELEAMTVRTPELTPAERRLRDILQLREVTGAGMRDCKRALEEAKGDINVAHRFLREKPCAAGTVK